VKDKGCPYMPSRNRRGRGLALSILNLGTRWGWLFSVSLAAVPLGKRPSTHCTGDWVGFTAGLDGSRKSCPHCGLNP